ncbi:hypothetical protein PIB30_096916 [Stylosanthes scabra]|uniref:Uncharacterized protein n=1 Tax=Stylosanthes scabra TaxID=79078 RepID=A0ABU6SXG7_9FABA|nr:hypothetical protein [Stylosanthes scabra]
MPPNRRKTTVKRKQVDEGEKEEKEEIERESEFDNQNKADDDQEERVQNKSLMTSSQVERELDNIWPTMVIDEEVILKADEDARQYFASKKKQNVIYAEYHDVPSFSLWFSQEFNTPTPSPDGSASEDAEVLDIPPIREILPEDIVIHTEQDPSTIRSLKPLTLEQENKTYQWVIKTTKANGVQEEVIALFRGYDNFFLSRAEIRFLRSKGWIDDKIINWKCKEYNYSSLPRFLEDVYCIEVGIMNTTITDKNLNAYHKGGTYVGMHPKLGKDGKHFDRNKATNRKWGRLIEDMLKIVIPTFDHKGVGFPSRCAQVPK